MSDMVLAPAEPPLSRYVSRIRLRSRIASGDGRLSRCCQYLNVLRWTSSTAHRLFTEYRCLLLWLSFSINESVSWSPTSAWGAVQQQKPFLIFLFLIQGVELVSSARGFLVVPASLAWPEAIFHRVLHKAAAPTYLMLSNQRPSRQPLLYSCTPGREPIAQFRVWTQDWNSGLSSLPCCHLILLCC